MIEKLKEDKFQLYILLGAIGFSLIVSLVWFIHDGINYQEAYNLKLSSLRHLSSIFDFGSNDDPMPLYFLLLHGVGSLIGRYSSLYVDRLLSLVAYCLAVVTVYLIGKLIDREGSTGVVAAVLVALSPFMVWYGSRATVYSLLAFMAALNQLAFIGIFKNRWWAIPLYALTCLIGLGLHYFFLAIIVPQVIYLIMRRKSKDLPRRSLFLALGSAALTIAVFCFWVIYSSNYVSYWGFLPFTAKPSATNTFIIYFQYLFGFQSVVITTLIISLWPLLVILALLAVQKYVRPPEGIKYLFVSAVLPMLLLFLLSWIWKPLFLSSYLIICLPAFLIFIAWYLSAFKLQALRLARYALAIGMAIMMALQIANWQRALSEDYLGVYPGSFAQVSQNP